MKLYHKAKRNDSSAEQQPSDFKKIKLEVE